MVGQTNTYRYHLDKGSKKFHCPQCDKRRWVRYVDSTTGNYLPFQFGRCDREMKCDYQLNPYQSGYAKEVWCKENGEGSLAGNYCHPLPLKRPTIGTGQSEEPVFLPTKVLQDTLKDYHKNQFIQNLLLNVPFSFKIEDVQRVIELYYLGTQGKGYCQGGTTFPFIDKEQHVRAIQVKTFDKGNHTIKTSFLHSIFKEQCRRQKQQMPNWLDAYCKQDRKVSCLFGEHLLSKYPSNPIALVEAPKTAIYGSLYFGFPDDPDQYLWLAVYNLSSLNYEKCQALEGRDVYLFPDLSEYGKASKLWCERANKLELKIEGATFHVSDFLERAATDEDKQKGLDLADYLIKQDWRFFR